VRILVDATTLIALGTVGELDLLTELDGELCVPHLAYEEVTTEPTRTNLDRFCRDRYDDRVVELLQPTAAADRGCDVLGDDEPSGDAQIIGRVAATREAGEPVGVVSDDRRVRTVARGLGATVTGTIGVVVRAVEDGLPPDEAKELVRRLDAHGLHMTGELRETADELIENAATRQ
jgi:predicted nucleic acid-binding protein